MLSGSTLHIKINLFMINVLFTIWLLINTSINVAFAFISYMVLSINVDVILKSVNKISSSHIIVIVMS